MASGKFFIPILGCFGIPRLSPDAVGRPQPGHPNLIPKCAADSLPAFYLELRSQLGDVPEHSDLRNQLQLDVSEHKINHTPIAIEFVR